MGQQQLLLVILVTIIVGIATVVALNVFGTQADEANRDAVRQDILSAAANAQGFYIRPEMMDGGGYSFDGGEDGDAITIDQLGIPGSEDGDTGVWENENGEYEITGGPNEHNFDITGTPSGGTDPIVATVEVSQDGDDEGEVTINWQDGGGDNGDN